MRSLTTERADNAPRQQECSITHTAVSPRKSELHVTTGDIPIIDRGVGATGERWESVDREEKRATINTDVNEVIEIPLRGHHRRITATSRRSVADPRNGGKNPIELVNAKDKAKLYAEIDNAPRYIIVKILALLIGSRLTIRSNI